MVNSSAPPALTPLLGRDAERARLDALLAGESRLVTLLGPPGIGKTRLAIEAHRAWEERGGRAAWVDLATTERAEELCARVAHALGLRLSWLGAGDMVDQLAFAIEGQGPALLVLDEAELCLDAIAQVVPRWLADAPDAVALVTSRERLEISGETVLELGPLGMEPPLEGASGQLLLQHAAMAAPEEPERRDALGRLVAALDGIPLAIELVAARMRVLAPEEILARFAERGLGALGGRRRPSSLHAALEASWQRLDEAEREALARCAVFVGDFDTEAAEAVLGEEALDLLQALRDQSLLARHDRRHRLYSPVRAYAAERLEELGLRADAEARHVACFADRATSLVAELRGPHGPVALKRLTTDLDQLRAAHARAADAEARRRLALGITEVLLTRGPAQDALPLLDADSPDPDVRLGRGRALEVAGRVEEASRELDAALDALPEDADAARARVLGAKSAVELARGNLERARALADEACGLAPEDDPVRVDALRHRAVAAHARGALDDAARDYEDARRLAEELGLVLRAAGLRADIGAVRLQERRLDEAREHYEVATETLDAEADPIALGLAEGNLAILAQELGDLDRAATLHARGIERLRRTGHRLYVAHLSGYAGAVEHERGELEAAIARYDEALRGLRHVGDVRLTAVVAALRGAAEAERGRVRAAEEAFAEAEAALERVEDPGIRRAVELHAHQLTISRADDEESRRAALATIAVSEGDEVVARSDDARIALRLLARRVGHGAITISVGEHHITLPDGETIDLSSRAILWRLVEALGRARAQGESLDPHALLEAGWPGEHPTGASGLNRVKVALSTLRKLGLRPVLVRTDDGYSLDPEAPLLIEEPD